MIKSRILGHVLAMITILIWGTTFVSTKILLTEFSPEEILIYRFFIALIIVIFIYHKGFKVLSFKEEGLFFLLGITGVSLYYWTENLALKYTYASNVGLIVTVIPIFTALIAHFVTRDEKLTVNLILGFVIAMMGIVIVMYNGKVLRLSLKGDFIALVSAVSFSIYSILVKNINKKYSQIFVVRKMFFYGVVTMLPVLFFSDISLFKISNLNMKMLLNIVYLSIFASILCFIMWNKAISVIGSVKTANYIYFVPVITIISSTIVLHERVNGVMMIGGILIVAGVFINESERVTDILKVRKKSKEI